MGDFVILEDPDEVQLYSTSKLRRAVRPRVEDGRYNKIGGVVEGAFSAECRVA